MIPPRPRPPKVPRPTPVPRVRSDLIDRLAPEDVPMFWEQIARTLPLVEETGVPGEAVVTFCWRDHDAEQVLLFANRLTDETDLDATLLERKGDTDLWHASFAMASDWRASYAFLVQRPGEQAPWVVGDQVSLRGALDQGRTDPRNPETCPGRHGALRSVCALPDAAPQPWLAPRADVERGSMHEDLGPDGRRVWLYDPAAFTTAEPLPLLVVLDGEVWAETHDLATTLDNLQADGTEPLRAVFLDAGDRDQRWAELSNDGAGVEYVVERLVPWVADRRGVRTDQVGVAGQSLGGLTALRAGLLRPDAVAWVASQSASLWQDDLAVAVDKLAGAERTPRIHLAHGLQEWVLAGPHRELAERLRAAGVGVTEASYNGGHDDAWWRGALADAVRWAAEPI